MKADSGIDFRAEMIILNTKLSKLTYNVFTKYW